MKKEELRETITKSVDEQKKIIENTNSISHAAREILGINSTLARSIIKDICNEQGWKIPTWYNRARYCLKCGRPIIGGDPRKKFCDHSCAASYNNRGVVRNGEPRNKKCLYCGEDLKPSQKSFCCHEHQTLYKYKEYIERWKKGEENGLSGKYGIAAAVRRYIFEKNDNKCEVCNRSYVNPYTGLSVLQIHHKDGDCTNNNEGNLQLLCPTHHAMTENFGSRNPNATRKDNRKRY